LRPDERLPKSERLTRQYEYRRVIVEGEPVGGRQFKTYLLRKPDLVRRAGFIAGKAVGNACARNRARRLLKEAYRRIKPRLEARGYNLVLVARPGISGAGSDEVEARLGEMARRLGLVVRG
jgi:ribonuclease P protein component